MARKKMPVTPAIRVLRTAGVSFSNHCYRYEPGGGTRVSARELAVDEHAVIKTLIMQNEKGGADYSCTETVKSQQKHWHVRWDQKRYNPVIRSTPTSTVATRWGTSPFGTRKKCRSYCETSIPQLPLIYINGGAKAIWFHWIQTSW